MQKISVIGAGAWGTALAAAITRTGCDVTLWAREEKVADDINAKHQNTVFLPKIDLPKALKATNNLTAALKADALFLVIPSQFMRPSLEEFKTLGLTDATPLVLCSKGVTQNGLKLMTEVAEETLPNPVAVLSGPTFASEVARGLPASATLACKDEALRDRLKATIRSESFKILPSDDLIGAEIGGAIKNVIAIACGIATGKELGQNAVAALITRGLEEMRRLCIAKGGRADTLMGLCGIGDLILTCSSQESRNMSLGYALGQGKTLEAIMNERVSVAEGVASSESVVRLAKKLGVSLPVCEAVDKIVHGKANIEDTIQELIKRS